MPTDKIKTGVILIFALSGVLFFGYRAVRETKMFQNTQNNPFEYSVDAFEKFDPALNHYQELVGGIAVDLTEIYGLTVDSDDRLLVSGDQSVVIFEKDSKEENRRFDVQGHVRCLDTDRDGKIYCALLDQIVILDSDGNQQAAWSEFDPKTLITSIAVGDEYVYVADAGALCVWQLGFDGEVIRKIGEKNTRDDIPGFVIPSPYFDVAVDEKNNLWAANSGRHSLENYTPDGRFRSSWGEASMRIEGFAGCCNPSHFCILPNGNFVSSEKGIVRIKVLDEHGRLISVVAGPDQFKKGLVGVDLDSDSEGRIYALDRDLKRIRIFQKKSESLI